MRTKKQVDKPRVAGEPSVKDNGVGKLRVATNDPWLTY